jgi:HrpA-like RNA helicase
VKEMAFEPATGIQKLSEFWISISSAKQRSGRAGRTGPGVVSYLIFHLSLKCYRLYTKAEYDHFNEFPVPEILRSPLDGIFLQIFAYPSIASLSEFEFLQTPDPKIVHASLKRLVGVGAVIDMRGSDFWFE